MKLIVYPTLRAIRFATDKYKKQNTILPYFITMGEFESRCVIIPKKIQVDTYERIFLLREIVADPKFDRLKYNLDLLYFFTQSDAIFKFFEELSNEGVEFANLRYCDAYGEFEEHIDILEKLYFAYEEALEKRGLIDKCLVPKYYQINDGFISNFDEIEIYIEGYLSNFEFEIIELISKKTRLILHFQTNKYSKKMEESFGKYGLKFEFDSNYEIDFSEKKILNQEKIIKQLPPKIFSTKERFEQFGIAFLEIQKMVESGILPENIALILPDEEIVEALNIFDRSNNLNFAMGFTYKNHKNYKALQAIEEFWKTFSFQDYNKMSSYGIAIEDGFDSNRLVNGSEFFDFIKQIGLLGFSLEDANQDPVNQKLAHNYFHISTVFANYKLSYKEWLYLWLQLLSSIRIDDSQGGKITVIGALESRGASFEGLVVIDFNEGVIPLIPSKDNFLNSSVREFALLPTISDREAHQKQLYIRAMQRAKQSVFIYSTENEKLPSRFLYELEIFKPSFVTPSSEFFYKNCFIQNKNDDIEILFNPHEVAWSSARLKIFLECKKRYYYRYIKGIKQKENQDENEGSFIHRLLENVFRDESHFENIDDLSKKISSVLDAILGNTPQDIYNKTLYSKMLRPFFKEQILHFKKGWRVVGVEKQIKGEIDGLSFNGRCDRIDQDDISTYVLDYKSGKSANDNKSKFLDNQTDFQMNIYKALLGKEYKNLDFAFVRIFDGGRFEEVNSFEKKDELFFDIIASLKQTTSFVNAKCEDFKKCNYCEFALMCKRGDYL